MAKAYRRIYQLARIAGRTESEVLAMVRAVGVEVSRGNDLVPANRLDLIDKLLGINRWAPLPLRDGMKARLVGDTTGFPSELSPPASQETTPADSILVPKPRLPKWPTVGQPTERILSITADQVEQIHWLLVDDFKRGKDPIDPPGIRSRHLLESALHRTNTSLGNEAKYPTVPMVAAALLHAIISNHPFHNGNKRTALVATLAFLDINAMLLEADENELYDYLVKIASHEVETAASGADDEMLAIARWIHRQSRSISNEEKVIKFHDLRTILLRYGCTFEHPGGKGNRINIMRGALTTQVYYRNEGTDVERNTIRQIRKDLGLTDEHGYDSAIFYKAEDRVPAFIHKYRRTLDRLAKV